MNPHPLARFIDALSDLCGLEDRPEAKSTAQLLRSGGMNDMALPKPACRFDAEIRGLLAQTDTALSKSMMCAMDWIDWGVNPVSDQMPEGPAAMIGVATFLGPEGPIPSSAYRLGLLFMRGGCYYPMHDHDADETYTILSGKVLWTAGDNVKMRGQGEMIHHPSNLPHAFCTADTNGFIALWRWSGDINTHSYRFLPDPTGIDRGLATGLAISAGSLS